MTAVSTGPLVEPFGDQAILVTVDNRITVRASRRANRLAAALAGATERGLPFGAAVCGYATVLVPYDGAAITVDEAIAEVGALVRRVDGRPLARRDPSTGPVVEVPTLYGGTDGPDLDAVASAAGLTAAGVVEIHAGTEYRVFMLGFVPGFAYLGLVPAAIAAPRRPTPRQRVPRGSVAIADRQTAVYPYEVPGGWNLIGRTELTVWDPARRQPALFSPGGRVRFVPAR